jgi:hypothetical protein
MHRVPGKPQLMRAGGSRDAGTDDGNASRLVDQHALDDTDLWVHN